MRAFCVHLLTASGAGLSLLALLLAAERHFTAMFLVLGAALIVDGVDGPLARRWNVAGALPRWSGDTLDFVVDYTTYVFVPAFAIVIGGLMPDWLGIVCGLAIAVSGALYFADRDMKTDDNRFKGFPAVWNVVAFYLLALKPDGWICAGVILLLAILTFAPVCFVHPLRVRRGRTFNIALLVVWAILAALTVRSRLAPDAWLSAGLLITGGYFLLAGLRAAPRGG
ncbi:MAG: phosphatidylcholine/phosphatidylserine synthase [Xanthobacteraceae bacterium]|uniref:CDP-alcohol phosphatidyltransferase family protein n=1 Tax=Pseudolabrys sp. TaxID=1960880 RepID=UPI003D120A03